MRPKLIGGLAEALWIRRDDPGREADYRAFSETLSNGPVGRRLNGRSFTQGRAGDGAYRGIAVDGVREPLHVRWGRPLGKSSQKPMRRPGAIEIIRRIALPGAPHRRRNSRTGIHDVGITQRSVGSGAATLAWRAGPAGQDRRAGLGLAFFGLLGALFEQRDDPFTGLLDVCPQ